MNRWHFILLIAGLAACGRKPAEPPAPAALGAELATFPQVLLPLTEETVRDFNALAERAGPEAAAKAIRPTYAHAPAAVNGSTVTLFVAYSSPWLAPKGIALQPVSVQQFLNAFSADSQTEITVVVSPQGKLFFTRAQMKEIADAAAIAGRSFAEIPFSVVSGSGR